MTQHLLDMDDLSNEKITALFQVAKSYETKGIPVSQKSNFIAPLFYENSTRTSASFEIAAKSLGFKVLNFSIENSSSAKGESIEDTIQTFIAMGISTIVMRHSSDSLIFSLKETFINQCSFINAGSGARAHPTQTLLDLYTLQGLRIPFSNLKVAVVGDLKHSRVVRSLIKGFKCLGLSDYRLVSPPEFTIPDVDSEKVSHSLADGLEGVDVVIALRVQKERFLEEERLDLESYQEHFCLTESLIKAHCPDAKIMHPGPMNRGVEISSELADGPRSLIFKQVRNGVLVRAALLEEMAV